MKNVFRLLRNRKGFSLTEVVIAMAVLLIVTGAAISVLIASVNSDVKYRNKTLALIGCENAVECVRFVEKAANPNKQTLLEEALVEVGFTEEDSAEDNGVYVLIYGDEKITVFYDTQVANYVVQYNDDIIYGK